MRLLAAMFGIALIGVSMNQRVAAQNAPDASESTGVTHLFNGKDLGGWYTFLKSRGRDLDPKKVFTVSDGMLRISGEEFGCVTSVKECENYHLVVEFRWGEQTCGDRKASARDSGVLVHSVGEDGAFGGIWMHAIECQMIEGGTGDVLVVGDGTDQFSVTCPVDAESTPGSPVFKPDGKPTTIKSGRVNWYGRAPDWKNVKGFRGLHDVEKPVGEWNRYECIADGNTLTLILNGVVVNKCLAVQPHKGRIQIQSEGAEVFVRRVDVSPLPPSKPAL